MLVMLFSCYTGGVNAPLFIMEKTLYVINRFGSLAFSVGGTQTLIGGVRPFDTNGLRLIRVLVEQEFKYNRQATKDIEFSAELIFTNVRNG